VRPRSLSCTAGARRSASDASDLNRHIKLLKHEDKDKNALPGFVLVRARRH
jgi:hypothetical protein